ncbi:MAG: putative addiction module component [Chloroflexi bacterium]|nr:putative addiction module component [Chloroflexota bacterium]
MKPKTGALLTEALKLPPEVVGQLTQWDPDIEAAWIEEADRRWLRLESGATGSVPWDRLRDEALGSQGRSKSTCSKCQTVGNGS